MGRDPLPDRGRRAGREHVARRLRELRLPGGVPRPRRPGCRVDGPGRDVRPPGRLAGWEARAPRRRRGHGSRSGRRGPDLGSERRARQLPGRRGLHRARGDAGVRDDPLHVPQHPLREARERPGARVPRRGRDARPRRRGPGLPRRDARARRRRPPRRRVRVRAQRGRDRVHRPDALRREDRRARSTSRSERRTPRRAGPCSPPCTGISSATFAPAARSTPTESSSTATGASSTAAPERRPGLASVRRLGYHANICSLYAG